MKLQRPNLPIALSLMLAGLAACSSADLSGPPTLRPGRDACAGCGMLISEDRCASALLVEVAGRREHLIYDDIGCMLAAEGEGLGGGRVLERFVHDHGSRQWIAAADATFLMADPKSIATPMGSGIIAFARRTEAQAGQGSSGGEILDWSTLVLAEQARAKDRYANQNGPSR